MLHKNIEIAVGALMLAGILAMAFLALQVSSQSLHKNGDGYTVTAYFTNVSGLTEKAKVSLAGVTVGRVTQISIDPKTLKAKVTLVINKDVNYLAEDTSAVVQTAGVLGEKYIGLYPGIADQLLENGSTIYNTQSSLILEDLIGKLVAGMAAKS